MPNCFPDNGSGSLAEKEPEEAHDDNWKLLHVVSVNIDIDEETDQRTGTDENSPVPLPAPSYGVKSPFFREIRLPMLREDGNRQDKSDAIGYGDADPRKPAQLDRVNGRVTLGRIHKAAVCVK